MRAQANMHESQPMQRAMRGAVRTLGIALSLRDDNWLHSTPNCAKMQLGQILGGENARTIQIKLQNEQA
jgi:hypothetical protein